jgi:ribosomal protein L40E
MSMRCQKCSAENPEGAKFCIQCATALRRLCRKSTTAAQCGLTIEQVEQMVADGDPADLIAEYETAYEEATALYTGVAPTRSTTYGERDSLTALTHRTLDDIRRGR